MMISPYHTPMKKIFLALMGLSVFMSGMFVSFAQKIPTMEFFHGETCPHCKDEIRWFPELRKMYPDIQIKEYEVWYNASNAELFRRRLAELGATSSGVPTNIIGDEVVVGFRPEAIVEALERHFGPPVTSSQEIDMPEGESEGWRKYLDASWPVMSLVLGLLDGFNPCAMWTLFILLGFLLSIDDARKRWLIGIIFVGSSAVIYFLALLAYLLGFEGIMSVVNGSIMGWVFRGVGMIAFVTGVIALKEAFQKKVECDVRDAKSRKKFKDRLADILAKENIWLILLGVIGLAFSVNMIELLCSFAIPTTFTATLVALELSLFDQITALVLYIITYILDDVVVLTIGLYTLNLKILSTRFVQYSHLIGGIILILLGLFLLFDPSLLDTMLLR